MDCLYIEKPEVARTEFAFQKYEPLEMVEDEYLVKVTVFLVLNVGIMEFMSS